MADASRNVPHLTFFERIANLEEGSDEYRVAAAGLVTLRLVDQMLAREPLDQWNIRAVRETANAIEPTDPARGILAGIIDLASEQRAASPSPLLARVMAFARALDLRGDWPLATAVYQHITHSASDLDLADLAMDAWLRLGYCQRVQGHWEESLDAYLMAGRIAESVGDNVRAVRVKVAHAQLAIERGNIPQAEEILDSVIAECGSRRDYQPVAAVALHERAVVAYSRRDFDSAVQYAHSALQIEERPVERDRLLSNIAGLMVELGLRSAAWDAYLIIAATAQEQYMRWTAVMNLMEMAAFDGHQVAFERYRDELARVQLPPRLRVYYHTIEGTGLATFGDVNGALRSYDRAIAAAKAEGVNELLFQAETARAELEAHQRIAPKPAPDAEVSDSAREIADALHERRVAAGL